LAGPASPTPQPSKTAQRSPTLGPSAAAIPSRTDRPSNPPSRPSSRGREAQLRPRISAASARLADTVARLSSPSSPRPSPARHAEISGEPPYRGTHAQATALLPRAPPAGSQSRSLRAQPALRTTPHPIRIAHKSAARTQRPRRDSRGSHAEDHPYCLFNAPCTPLNPIPTPIPRKP